MDYSDLGYPDDKILRNLNIEIDTGGVAATITLMVDGVATSLGTVTTTFGDRKRIIAIPSSPIGKMVRLEILPGVGGNKAKTHLFTITSANSFKLYRDGSRLEWLPCGSDQREDYQQLTLSELMGPQ